MSCLEGARAGIFSTSDTRGRVTSHAVTGLDEKFDQIVHWTAQRPRVVDMDNNKKLKEMPYNRMSSDTAVLHQN